MELKGAMATLECSTLQGLWKTPKTKVGSLLKTQGLPRARPARVTMAMKMPHFPNDPFLAHLAAAASTDLGKAQLANARGVSSGPPLLDIVADNVMMAAPAQVIECVLGCWWFLIPHKRHLERWLGFGTTKKSIYENLKVVVNLRIL